jgi:6-phosphofructokinase 1
MVAWRDRNVVDIAIRDAVAAPAIVDLDGPVVRTARGLGICLGDR